MRLRELSISVATILSLTTMPAFAGPKGTAPKGGPKTATATHGSPKTTTASAPKTTTHGPKTTTTTHGSPKTTTAAAPKAHGPKATSTTTASTTTSGSTSSGSTSTSSTSTGSTSTSSTGTTATTPPDPLNPIAQKVSSNKGLSSKMTNLLPANMSLNEASKGFKNQGQFIAALHVSQNLNIPFADLKQAMTGIRPVTTIPGGTTGGTTGGTATTTTEPPALLSLGQAIKKLRNGVDADGAATTATQQASADISSTSTTSTSSTPSTTSTTSTTTTAPKKKNGK